MSSAHAKSPLSVLPILDPRSMTACGSGEVLWVEFNGDPLITIYDPIKKRGSAATLDRSKVEEHLFVLRDQAKKIFGAPSLDGFHIKVITTHRFEGQLKELTAKYGIKVTSFATFENHTRLDCYFYSDTGRLRAAPSLASTPNAVKKDAQLQSQSKKKRVLIVDDSRTIRQLLKNIINGSPELEVVGEADRPSQVEGLIEQLKPDVMTLDINMPEMSGVELLYHVLAKRFIPTVMISSLNIDQGNEVLDALEIGAVDYIHKPAGDELAIWTPIIQEKIAHAARVKKRLLEATPGKEKELSIQPAAPIRIRPASFESKNIIAIGASTGGTEAIKRVLLEMPEDIPPILIVQHIPPYFSTAFAKRLNDLCKFEVREAEDGDEIRPGRVLIAPGGKHLEVKKVGAKYFARVYEGKPVNRFMPSVDVLFNSVAEVLGTQARGVIMTGMGNDGAKGMLAMKNAGAVTIAQDEYSCVVYGMPRSAVEAGAVTVVKPLDEIAETLMRGKAS